MSKIEWTEETWNPVTGCTRVSAGCEHCYAERQSFRNEAMGIKQYQGITKKVGDKIRWTGKIGFAEHLLDKPLRRKKPTTYFVNSMSDLFHEDVPFEYVDKVFAVMALCPQHTFQVLTKRPERMADYAGSTDAFVRVVATAMALTRGTGAELELRRVDDYRDGFQIPNVWLGTSVENAETMHRIDTLRKVPAAIRFLSLEPLLGPLPDLNLEGIDWVIVGCESGPGARPMELDWVYKILDRCQTAKVPFFFKQMIVGVKKTGLPELDGKVWDEMPGRG